MTGRSRTGTHSPDSFEKFAPKLRAGELVLAFKIGGNQYVGTESFQNLVYLSVDARPIGAGFVDTPLRLPDVIPAPPRLP